VLLIYLAMCGGAFAAGLSLLNALRRRGQAG
jgi:hypothetical protein